MLFGDAPEAVEEVARRRAPRSSRLVTNVRVVLG
jgi:hypothetical protein